MDKALGIVFSAQKSSVEVVIPLSSPGQWRNTSSLVTSGCDSQTLFNTITGCELWPCCWKLLLGHGSCPPWCNIRMLPWCWACQHLAQRLQAKCLCIYNECVSREFKVGLPVGEYSPRLETLQSPAQGLEKWTQGNCIIFLHYCFCSSYVSTFPNSIINTWYLLKLLLSNMSAKSRAPGEV